MCNASLPLIAGSAFIPSVVHTSSAVSVKVVTLTLSAGEGKASLLNFIIPFASKCEYAYVLFVMGKMNHYFLFKENFPILLF